MSTSVRRSSRQSPAPSPTPPARPLSALPCSKSCELKWMVSPALMAKVIRPRGVPASSTARSVTTPSVSLRLTMRAKPCPEGESAARKRGTTRAALRLRGPGRDERLVRPPVCVLASRLINTRGWSACTVRRHLPCPSPRRPCRPSPPDSSSAAVSSRAAPGAKERATSPPGDSPWSSTPRIVTSAASSPMLTRRSRLAWRVLLAGLKVGTRWPPGPAGTVSCMLVRKPSVVRMYACTAMSSPEARRKRQFPSPSPTPSAIPLAALPRSKSSELKWMVCRASRESVIVPRTVPESSMASTVSSPAASERLTTRTNPWCCASSAAASNGTEWVADAWPWAGALA